MEIMPIPLVVPLVIVVSMEGRVVMVVVSPPSLSPCPSSCPPPLSSSHSLSLSPLPSSHLSLSWHLPWVSHCHHHVDTGQVVVVVTLTLTLALVVVVVVVVVVSPWHLPWASRCRRHHVPVALAIGIASLSSS